MMFRDLEVPKNKRRFIEKYLDITKNFIADVYFN